MKKYPIIKHFQKKRKEALCELLTIKELRHITIQEISSMIEGGFRYIQTNKKGVDCAQSKDFINNTLIELDKYIEESMKKST